MACLADDFVRQGESTNWLSMSKENYRDMLVRLHALFPDFRWEPNCMVVSDDTVAIEVIETGTFTEPWTCQGKTLRPTGKGYRHGLPYFSVSMRTGLSRTARKKRRAFGNLVLLRVAR